MRELLFALLMLAGCTGAQVRPAATDVRLHYVADVQNICEKLVGHWDIYLGCAWYNTNLSSCDKFVPTGAAQWVIDHEQEHCSGKDH